MDSKTVFEKSRLMKNGDSFMVVIPADFVRRNGLKKGDFLVRDVNKHSIFLKVMQ